MNDSAPKGPLYLPRLLSKWRIASRSAAEDLVRKGRVRVNGVVRKDVLMRVDPVRDLIELDGAKIRAPEDRMVWLMLNKPRGLVCTTKDEAGRATVMDCVKAHLVPGLAPVGRLDRASAGLLLLTNDHATADLLLDPKHHVQKVYRVKVAARLRPEDLAALRLPLAASEDHPAFQEMEVAVESEGPKSTWLRIGLSEGKNRQIRRRLEILGFEVQHLVRLSFGPLVLGDLEPGAVRPLSEAEVLRLKSATAKKSRR